MSDPDGRSRDGPTLIPRDPRGEGKMFQNLEGRRKKREEKREKKKERRKKREEKSEKKKERRKRVGERCRMSNGENRNEKAKKRYVQGTYGITISTELKN